MDEKQEPNSEQINQDFENSPEISENRLEDTVNMQEPEPEQEPEPGSEPEPTPDSEEADEGNQENKEGDETEAETEGQGLFGLIPESLVENIRQQVSDHGKQILAEHKDMVSSLASQVSGHAQTIQDLQEHITQLRDMKTNPNSPFLKAGYQLLQNQQQ
jgi:hypothetical protein